MMITNIADCGSLTSSETMLMITLLTVAVAAAGASVSTATTPPLGSPHLTRWLL